MTRHWPLPKGRYTITSRFAGRANPITGKPENHSGIDLAAPDGTPFRACAGGTIQHIGKADGYGQWIVIDHPTADGGGCTEYGHMWNAHATGLKIGQRVEAGQVIGYVGSNGQSTGPHLHLTVWERAYGGRRIDPETWLRDAIWPGEAPKEAPVTGDPTWLPDVLKAAGLKCDVFPGAYQRGHGDFRDIWGIIIHHTGSNQATPASIAQHPQLGLCSQLHLGRDGKYTLCGVGIAWHAGAGAWPGIQTNNANQVTIGIEAANDGRSGWSKDQYDAYVTGVAAILNKLSRDSSRVIGHKEWAGPAQGKWDPGGVDMNAFRAAVKLEQARLKGISVGSNGPVNKIDQEAKLAAGWIGKRLFEGEKPIGADGLGRYADFTHGTIFWHPEVHRANGNAIAVPTHLLETWRAYGGVSHFLGYPVRRHTVVPGVGDIQAFQGGVIYRRYGHFGYPVRGEIGKQWAAQGYETGKYGWPVSDEYTVQDFERGQLRWNRPTGA